MSKSLSIFKNAVLFVLLIVPMMFMFTACEDGQLGTQAKCDTRGNYTESTMETFNTVATDTATTLGDSYRMTVKLKMNMGALISGLSGQAAAQDSSVDLTINVIVTSDAVAMKMSGKADGEKRDVTMYVANGKMYAYDAVSKEKVYIEVAANADLQTVLAQLKMDRMLQSANLASILENVRTAGNVTVTANGNHFKLEYTASSLPNIVYLNFDNAGKFEAVKAEMNLGFMEMSATMSVFDGEIQLPNFDGYKQVNDLDFLDDDEGDE